MKKKIYIAAPLFSKAELDFNLTICKALSAFYEVFLPQRDGGLLEEMVLSGMPAKQASKLVFTSDINAINNSDVLLAVLDGRTIDEGVSVELGYAYAKNKKCIGLHTCPRRLLATGNNPMIDNVLSEVFISLEELEEWAKSRSDSNNLDSHNLRSYG